VFQIFQEIAKCCCPQRNGTFQGNHVQSKSWIILVQTSIYQSCHRKISTCSATANIWLPFYLTSTRNAYRNALLEKISASGKQPNRTKGVLCVLEKRVKLSMYCCPDCQAGLCLEEGFKPYDTKLKF
jgi:hypothetical protein